MRTRKVRLFFIIRAYSLTTLEEIKAFELIREEKIIDVLELIEFDRNDKGLPPLLLEDIPNDESLIRKVFQLKKERKEKIPEEVN